LAIGQKFLAAGNVFQNPLKALEPAGAIMSALNAVHEQQKLFLVAQRAQTEQIFRRGRRDAAFALHAFHQDGDSRGRNRVACGGQIIERNVPEARRCRLETFLDLVLAGRGDARQRAPVK
jgi:hypothetical protein